MVRAGNPRSPGGCRDHLWIPASTDAGGYKARHRAAGLERMDPQSELSGLPSLGTGRVLLVRHHNLRLLRSLKASDLFKSAFHPFRNSASSDFPRWCGARHPGRNQQAAQRLRASDLGFGLLIFWLHILKGYQGRSPWLVRIRSRRRASAARPQTITV